MNQRLEFPRAAIAGAAICLAFAAVACATKDQETSGCAWGPVHDVKAVQAILDGWAAATRLPPFDKRAWDLSIDRSDNRLTLRFAQGTLTLAWRLDETCEPTAITVEASRGYAGLRPDDDAVERLVASFRTVVVEQHPVPRSSHLASRGARLIDLGIWVTLAGLLIGAWWRWRAAGLGLREPIRRGRALLGRSPTVHLVRLLGLGRTWLRGSPPARFVRLVGLVGIVCLLPFESPPPGWFSPGAWLVFNSPAVIAVALIAFLWLAASGFFGYGTARRDDWPAIPAFLFALAVRAGYARHGIEGVVLHFNSAGVDPESFPYTFYLTFVQRLARDPFPIVMHVNAVLGAAAVLPLYLFVRQRTAAPAAALLATSFYAAHPILVQMAPTDSPYSLCFATWFMGLALLTAPDIGARALWGGATLLGIAATCRPEGGLFLPASLLLVDVRALLRAVRRHLGAAVLALASGLGLLAAEVHSVFPGHVGPGDSLPVPDFDLESLLRAGLWSTDYNDLSIVLLVIVGATAGLVNEPLQIGLGAAAGTLLVVWPFIGTTVGGYTILHRLSATCALQVIAAGIGAAWIASWLPGRRLRWAAHVAAVLTALSLLVIHRHEIHDPIGITDEFWMLRNHLAPGGRVKKDCTLAWVGRSMDTDIHNFADILPGMPDLQCQEKDCLAEIAKGGCFYYMRGLNCFHSDAPTTPECVKRGKTPSGGHLDCIDPECVRVETSLRLELIEQRTVDVHSVWNYEHGEPSDPHFPFEADVGLYRVVGVKH